MRKYYCLIIMFLLQSVFHYTTAQAQMKFNDVDDKQYAWATDAINFMTSNNVISGFPDGTFKPQKPVTKAELSIMLYRLFDKYRPNTLDEPRNKRILIDNNPNAYREEIYTNIKSFADVPVTHWALREISELYDSQFKYEFNTNGKNELLFEPDHRMTRLETSRLLSICFDQILNPDIKSKALLSTLSKMKDVKLVISKNGENISKYQTEQKVILGNNWGKHDYSNITKYLLLSEFIDGTNNNETILTSGDFIDYQVAQTIANFQQQGIVTTDNNGLLHPTEILTRAQVVTILYRIHSLIGSQGVIATYSSILSDSSSLPATDSKETTQTTTRQLDKLDTNGTAKKDLKNSGEIDTTVSTAGKKTMALMLQSTEKVDLYLKFKGQTSFIRQEELPMTIPVDGINEVRITTQVRTPNVNRPVDFMVTLAVKLK